MGDKVTIDVASRFGPALDVIQGAWPLELVEAELAWHAATGAKLPTVRALAERWGWSKSRVDRFLRNGTTVGQPWDKNGTTDPQETPNMPRDWDSRGTAVGQQRDSFITRARATGAHDARAPARVQSKNRINYVNSSLIYSARKESETTVKSADPAYESVHTVFLDEIGPLVGRKRKRRIQPSSPLGKQLSARIADYDADTVISVLRWWATSPHKRAIFLRENG